MGRTGAEQDKQQTSTRTDGISWRLIKILMKTQLGQQLVREVARVRDMERMQEESRDMTMVMMPNPRKDHGSERLASHRASKQYRHVVREIRGGGSSSDR